MKKAGCLVAILLGSCLISFAQGAKKDYPKFEFFLGYSRETTSNNDCAVRVATGTSPPYCAVRFVDYIVSDADYYKRRPGLHGIEASAIYNFTSYVGLKGDFSAHFKNELVTATYPEGTVQFRAEGRLMQYLAGPELKLRNKSALTPFAYTLIGRAHAASKITGQTAPNTATLPAEWLGDTRLASAVGGGLDIQVSQHASIRSSIDYNPVRSRMAFMGGPGETQNNVRTSIGVLFR
jgi:opacity protein-like surface antigen